MERRKKCQFYFYYFECVMWMKSPVAALYKSTIKLLTCRGRNIIPNYKDIVLKKKGEYMWGHANSCEECRLLGRGAV
jgi:hypothetical protein